jgi:hypothetical protein
MVDVASALLYLLTASIALTRTGEILILRFVNQILVDGLTKLLAKFFAGLHFHGRRQPIPGHSGPPLQCFCQQLFKFVHRRMRISL